MENADERVAYLHQYRSAFWRPERQGEQQQQNKFKLVKLKGLCHEMEKMLFRISEAS
jgi:hypothetical protein